MVDSIADLAVFPCPVVTGVTALVAILARREHAWAAFAAVAPLLFEVAMNVGSLQDG
jgi:hypothetical protein